MAVRRRGQHGGSGRARATGPGDGTAGGVTAKPAVVPEKSSEGVDSPFILSEALLVVSAKLVCRILRGEYINMAALLKDNIEAERRRLSVEGGSHFNRREVPEILSWLQCFNLYMVVVVSVHPEKTRELLAYQALIVSEARRGGRGWRLYDVAFRQQIRSFGSVDFSRINQSLYSTTILAFGGGRQKFCPVCMLSDHTQEECGLHQNHGKPIVQVQDIGAALPRGPERRKRERMGGMLRVERGQVHVCEVPLRACVN